MLFRTQSITPQYSVNITLTERKHRWWGTIMIVRWSQLVVHIQGKKHIYSKIKVKTIGTTDGITNYIAGRKITLEPNGNVNEAPCHIPCKHHPNRPETQMVGNYNNCQVEPTGGLHYDYLLWLHSVWDSASYRSYWRSLDSIHCTKNQYMPITKFCKSQRGNCQGSELCNF